MSNRLKHERRARPGDLSSAHGAADCEQYARDGEENGHANTARPRDSEVRRVVANAASPKDLAAQTPNRTIAAIRSRTTRGSSQGSADC